MPRKDLARDSWTHDDWVLYTAWKNMRSRCRPNHEQRWCYYDRGITVCPRWILFENFRQDMGYKPTPKHTMERIDNDKGYTPENCKWATRSEQQYNHRPYQYVKHTAKRNITLYSQPSCEG